MTVLILYASLWYAKCRVKHSLNLRLNIFSLSETLAMFSRKDIETTLISLAEKQGLRLNGKDLLDIRTKVAATLAAKERYKQRLDSAGTFKWKKPAPPR